MSTVRARLHQCQCQCSVNAAMTLVTALIDHNGIAPKWVAIPFPGDSILVSESCVARVIVALTLH